MKLFFYQLIEIFNFYLSFYKKSLAFLFYEYNYYFVSFSHSFEVTDVSDFLFKI